MNNSNSIFLGQLTWDDAKASQAYPDNNPSWVDFKRHLLSRLGDKHFLLIKYRQCFGDICVHQWETLTFYNSKRTPKAHNIDLLTRATTLSDRQAKEIIRQMKEADKEIWLYRCEHGTVYDFNPPKGQRLNPEARCIN
jgi:hypothetical protein